ADTRRKRLRAGVLASDEEHYPGDRPDEPNRTGDELRRALSSAGGAVGGAAGPGGRRAVRYPSATGCTETTAGRILVSTGWAAHVGLRFRSRCPLGVQDY